MAVEIVFTETNDYSKHMKIIQEKIESLRKKLFIISDVSHIHLDHPGVWYFESHIYYYDK